MLPSVCTLDTFSESVKVCMCPVHDGGLLQFQLSILGGPLVAGEGSALQKTRSLCTTQSCKKHPHENSFRHTNAR